jgi:hypothetical protein
MSWTKIYKNELDSLYKNLIPNKTIRDTFFASNSHWDLIHFKFK